MPTIYELFGKPVIITKPDEIAARKAAMCPFTQSRCDGGGNRHQTKIKLNPSHKLRSYFDEDIASVIPGVCSIDYGKEAWVVCPRRLLGFKHDSTDLPEINASLQDHERDILLSANLCAGVDIGIWPEVYLRHGDDEENSLINYHFDFIAAPLINNISAIKVFQEHRITDETEQHEIIKCARKGNWVEGKYSKSMKFKGIPDLSKPIIIEVMTASTSGSDTVAGTDIASSFTSAILGKGSKSPGINKRQVWGRMATQLFAKSALAEAWGGEAIWVVQDQLLDNIELTTKLSLDRTSAVKEGNINFISMTYGGAEQMSGDIHLKAVSKKKAGISFFGNDTAVDILLPKTFPNKKELLKAMLRRNLAAIVNLNKASNLGTG